MSRVALAAMLLGACGASSGGDGGADSPPEGLPSETHTYVVSHIDVGPASMDGLSTYGVDLDGVTSNNDGSCTGQPDTRSAITDQPGNDNQLAPLLPVLDTMAGPEGQNGALRARILSGELLIAIEVGDINSFTNDSSVTVNTFLGRVRTGDTLPIDATGLALAPGTRVERAADLGTVVGTIVNGSLIVDTHATLQLLSIGSPAALLPLTDVHFRARITASSITRGELGGDVRFDDLVVWLASSSFMTDPNALEATVMPDLDPDATGAHCHGVSLGAEFDAVTATRLGP